MKIVEKVTFFENTKAFFNYKNVSQAPIIIPIFYAHSISGSFRADAHLAPTDKDEDDFEDFWYTRLWYDPYYSKNDDGSLYLESEETDTEHNFRSLPHEKQDNPSHDDNEYLNSPITIPPGTQWLSVIINAGDHVTIYANYRITYVIIDNDGNELSFDEAIDKKIAEKLLEMNR